MHVLLAQYESIVTYPSVVHALSQSPHREREPGLRICQAEGALRLSLEYRHNVGLDYIGNRGLRFMIFQVYLAFQMLHGQVSHRFVEIIRSTDFA
jgi:hypothetical protein